MNKAMLNGAAFAAAELERTAMMARIETIKAQRNNFADRCADLAAELGRATGLNQVFQDRIAILEVEAAKKGEWIAHLEQILKDHRITPLPVGITDVKVVDHTNGAPSNG